MRKLTLIALISAFAAPAMAEIAPNERDGLPMIHADIQGSADVTKASMAEVPDAKPWALEDRDRNR